MRDAISDTYALAASSAQVEGVSVLVVASVGDRIVSEADARAVAPDLAAALYPGRQFGRVLNIEAGPLGWQVDVAVIRRSPIIVSRIQNGR